MTRDAVKVQKFEHERVRDLLQIDSDSEIAHRDSPLDVDVHVRSSSALGSVLGRPGHFECGVLQLGNNTSDKMSSVSHATINHCLR